MDVSGMDTELEPSCLHSIKFCCCAKYGSRGAVLVIHFFVWHCCFKCMHNTFSWTFHQAEALALGLLKIKLWCPQRAAGPHLVPVSFPIVSLLGWDANGFSSWGRRWMRSAGNWVWPCCGSPLVPGHSGNQSACPLVTPPLLFLCKGIGEGSV